MKICTHQIDTLPRLSWCLRISRNNDEVDVWHGPWVETRGNFFCEGAWSGDYEYEEIEKTTLMGSGGRIHDGHLIISSPSHTLERLYLLRNRDCVFVSNSIVFLLCKADDAPHPRSLRYQMTLNSVIRGLNSYPRHLPTKRGNRIYLYCHCNLVINEELKIVEQPKPAVRDFVNFGDYRDFVANQIAAIVSNARDSRRNVKYEPITTISSGYDSPACAVFARENGCKKALTFVQARGEEKNGNEDSGAEIAACLGMSVEAFDRKDYLRESGFPEAEFFGGASGAMMSPLANQLEAKVVFSGHHGDKVWDRTYHEGCENLVRGDPSGNSQEEFRLRVGWIHMVVPFVGGTSYLSINKISRSPEMKPWSIGGRYDRPIPRRIAESAGIDRMLFGRKKRAAVIVPKIEGGYEKWMTRGSFQDFTLFCQKTSTVRIATQKRLIEAIQWLNKADVALNRRITNRLARHLGIRARLPYVIPRDLRFSSFGATDKMALLFQWSVKKLSSRYQFDEIICESCRSTGFDQGERGEDE